ncbi:hypothetical protein [Rhizobium sp. FKL33]|nr:hypothetical protein [Rhizobium sp. FKL33]
MTYRKTLGAADHDQAIQQAYEIWREQSFCVKHVGLSLDGL